MPVEALKNIGATSAAWLRALGVETRADLVRLGPVFVYLLLRHRFPGRGIGLLMLYALEGALTGQPWTALDPDTRARLRAEAHGAALDTRYSGDAAGT